MRLMKLLQAYSHNIIKSVPCDNTVDQPHWARLGNTVRKAYLKKVQEKTTDNFSIGLQDYN